MDVLCRRSGLATCSTGMLFVEQRYLAPALHGQGMHKCAAPNSTMQRIITAPAPPAPRVCTRLRSSIR